MTPPRTGLLWLLVVGLAGVLSWPFFARPLRPWPDQGTVLQAAVRHARGEGLTTSLPSSDLSREDSKRLVYFPPFYPLLVSTGVRAGLDVELVVKIINALALLVGAWGWCRLATASLDSSSIRWLFGLLLVLAAGALVPKGGTMDYLLWAAMPWWAERLVAAHALASEAGGRALRACLAAGAVAATLVGVRWATVFLIPAAALFWLIAPAVTRRRRVVLAVAAGLPVVLAYLAITGANRLLAGGEGSLMQYLTLSWNWSRLRTVYPFESAFAIPLGLEPLLTRVWRQLDPARSSQVLAALFQILLPGVGVALLVRASLSSGRPLGRSPVARLALATWLALVAFLTWMSLRYTWSFADWTYLEEARYFRPVWPLCALGWLLLLDGLPASRLKRAGLWLSCLALIYLLQAQARWTLGALHPDESWELVQRVRAVGQQPGLHVVVDNDVSDYVVQAGPRLLARLYPDPAAVPALRASTPLHLWLVWRPDEPSAYVIEPDFDRKRFEALRDRFGAQRVWSSKTGRYQLYRAEVQPGT